MLLYVLEYAVVIAGHQCNSHLHHFSGICQVGEELALVEGDDKTLVHAVVDQICDALPKATA